jgi:hypothetical protein
MEELDQQETATEARCPCCDAASRRQDLTTCAGCGRAVCGTCVGFYGHYMLMCRECRLEDWR